MSKTIGDTNKISKILTAVSIKLRVLWAVVSCSLVQTTRLLGATFHKTACHKWNNLTILRPT
jgi:hypothetical protein